TYYSCWPLLYQMSLLLLNHVPLAKEPFAQQQTLSYTVNHDVTGSSPVRGALKDRKQFLSFFVILIIE
ncbi:MAG: hypothetical protein UC390_03120, partial [Peptococcaceae bacterium]|nr:hypothetical protein [Peptococcaceae bacterium]